LKAVIADTGPLYAQVDRDDRYHQQVRFELKKINRDKLSIIVPYPIYLEAHRLILYSGGSNVAIAFAQRINTKTNLINPTPEDYQTATELIARFSDQKIPLFDAVTAALAMKLNLPVWTYDYHFDVMGVQAWH